MPQLWWTRLYIKDKHSVSMSYNNVCLANLIIFFTSPYFENAIMGNFRIQNGCLIAKNLVLIIWNKIIYGQMITFGRWATYGYPVPPSPYIRIKLIYLEPWDILNSKSNLNIENIGVQTLYRRLIWRDPKYVFNNVAQFRATWMYVFFCSGKPIFNCYVE